MPPSESQYEIYKLTEPQLQVGMPNTHKWAVGLKTPHGTTFVDAFKTQSAAEQYIASREGNIELTAAEAKDFKTAKGMHGFAVARKLKVRAQRKSIETGKQCSLTYRGEVLYTVPTPTCGVCGGAHPEETHTPAKV